MKKSSIVLFMITIIMLIMVGCGSSPKSESEIKKDLVGKEINISDSSNTFLYGDSKIKVDEVEELTITKRQTNKDEKQDIAFITAKLKCNNVYISGDFQFIYTYYDQGGWQLTNTVAEKEVKITPIDKNIITPDELKKSLGLGTDEDVTITNTEFTQDKGLVVTAQKVKKANHSTKKSDMKYTLKLVEPKNAGDSFKWDKVSEDVVKEYPKEFDIKFDKTPDDIKNDIVEYKKLHDPYSHMLYFSSPNDIKSIVIKKEIEMTDLGAGIKGVEIELSDSYKLPVPFIKRKFAIDEIYYKIVGDKWVIETTGSIQEVS